MKKLFILAAMAAMFASCNDVCEDLVSTSSNNRVSAVAYTQMFTRATTASDSDLRQKGFWLTGVGESGLVFSGAYSYDKTAKLYTGPGYWSNGTMQFYASYPASLKWDGGLLSSISVENDPLIATAETSKVDAVSLEFHHIASRIGGNIVSKLSSNLGEVAVENAKISYTNVYMSGDYNGTSWSNPGTEASDVSLTSPAFPVYTNVIALAQGAKITFDFDITGAISAHRSYTYDIKELAQGYSYQYELTLNEQFEVESVNVAKNVTVDVWQTQKEGVTDGPEDILGDSVKVDPIQPDTIPDDKPGLMDLMGLMYDVDNYEKLPQQGDYASLTLVYDVTDVIQQEYVTAYTKAMIIMAKHDGYLQLHFQANIKPQLESIGVSSDVISAAEVVWTTGWETLSDKDADTVSDVVNRLKTAWQKLCESFGMTGDDVSMEGV